MISTLTGNQVCCHFQAFDRESKAKYTLTVEAQDQGIPSLTSTVTLDISVLDLNDNSPVFPRSSYSFDVSEDASEGSLVLEVSA